MNWLTASVLAALLSGIFPILASKASQIHGEKVNFFLSTLYMLIISIPIFIYGGGKHDFSRVTLKSFYYSLGLVLSCIGFLLILYALRLAPDKVPVIMVTVAFSMVITAVIVHFMGMRLDLYQWIGVFLAFC